MKLIDALSGDKDIPEELRREWEREQKEREREQKEREGIAEEVRRDQERRDQEQSRKELLVGKRDEHLRRLRERPQGENLPEKLKGWIGLIADLIGIATFAAALLAAGPLGGAKSPDPPSNTPTSGPTNTVIINDSNINIAMPSELDDDKIVVQQVQYKIQHDPPLKQELLQFLIQSH